MDEFGLAPKEIENECLDKAQGPNTLAQWTDLLRSWTRRVVLFICYVPGVFGFLWLIGRILRR